MTSRSAKLVGALSILLACGFVALAGVGGWLYWSQVEIQGEKDARITLAEKAKEQIPKVFGYDYQTVERSLNDIYPYLTPTYRREFQGSREQGHHPAGDGSGSWSARPMRSGWEC